MKNIIVVLASTSSEKSNIVVCADKVAVEKGFDSGLLIKKVAELAGGNGGGRKEMAMAGIKDNSKISFALEKVYELISNFTS